MMSSVTGKKTDELNNLWIVVNWRKESSKSRLRKDKGREGSLCLKAYKFNMFSYKLFFWIKILLTAQRFTWKASSLSLLSQNVLFKKFERLNINKIALSWIKTNYLLHCWFLVTNWKKWKKEISMKWQFFQVYLA